MTPPDVRRAVFGRAAILGYRSRGSLPTLTLPLTSGASTLDEAQSSKWSFSAHSLERSCPRWAGLLLCPVRMDKRARHRSGSDFGARSVRRPFAPGESFFAVQW